MKEVLAVKTLEDAEMEDASDEYTGDDFVGETNRTIGSS